MKQPTLFDKLVDTDEASGEKRRDAGIAQVTREKWFEYAIEKFREWAIGDDYRPFGFTGEDVRIAIQSEEGFCNPHHCNAWGALMMHLRRLEFIESTGEYRKSKDPTSHARALQVYRLVPGWWEGSE